MNPESKLARTRLEQAAQAKDKTRCARWILFVGSIAGLALLSFAAIDYGLLLPRHLRHATSATLALVVFLGLIGWRNLFRSPTSLKQAALDAETSGAGNDCVVSTAAEYASGKVTAGNAYEPELASALQSVAAQRLAGAPVPYRRTLWRPFTTLALSIIALALFVVLVPGGSTALQRVALPWLGAQYTRVEVQPQNIEVRLGNSVDITGKFFGRNPKDPQVHWQTNGDPGWRSASMIQSTGRTYAYPLTNVTVPVTYRVSGGDALSAEFVVTPYTPPEVKDWSVGLTYPEYTKLRPLTQSTPDITILRGSTAMVHVRANVNLSRARLSFADTRMAPVELRKGEDATWSGSLKITTNADYSIELFDEKGRRGENAATHRIVATLDAPPKVEILEPAQDMRADVTNRIRVKVSAADDYGVAGIKLVYHKLNAPERSTDCQTESVKNGEWIATADLNLATLDLKRYDVVAYFAEAVDNNTLDGPGVGRSPLYFVEISDKPSGPTPPPRQPLPGDSINLLVVQKQIIADTAMLNPKSPATNFVELALRQTNAMELGRMYLSTMAAAWPEAATEMNAAIASMEQAVGPLSQRDSAAALPLEEAALAHLYRVLALMPDLTLLAVKPKPQLPVEQKPRTSVALREIRKPAPDVPPVEPGIEEALQEARELSRAQSELNELAQKLVKAARKTESASTNSQSQQPQHEQAKGEGKGSGDGQGEGQGEGKGIEQAEAARPHADQSAEAKLQVKNTNSVAAAKNTNSITAPQPVAGNTNSSKRTSPQAQTAQTRSTNSVAQAARENSSVTHSTNAPKPAAQMSKAQPGTGHGAKPGKGRGKGKGKALAAGAKGKGKGQGTRPAGGAGQSSAQKNPQPPDGTPNDPADSSEPDSPEELAEKQEELSAEAKALREMLKRLAGKGTRVGHNLAVSANQAAEHMEGAAVALKQGNASGAGRRGTQGSEELNRLVTGLERVLGKRPDLVDVASEEAPKDYEAFIAEYFKRLSYEK